MSWNYRVGKKKLGKGVIYQIYEIYYKKNGEIEAMSKDPMEPYGETPDELKKDLGYMMGAFKHRVIDIDKLIKKKKWK